MPVVDTLRLKTRLSDGGMPETQAQVLVEELDEALTTAIIAQVATKADVVELRAAISAIHERFEQVDKQFEQVDNRLSDMNPNVNQRFSDMNQRFNELNQSVNQRFNELNQSVNQRFNELNQSVAQIRSWQVGLYVFIALGFLGLIAKDLIFN